MQHIRRIRQSESDVYTIVVTTNWNLPLTEHPSILEHPEVFEISDDELPEIIEFLTYTS